MIDIKDVKESIEKLGKLDIPERLTLVENIRSLLRKDPRYQTVETCYQALLMLTKDKKWVVRKAVAESVQFLHEKQRFDELIEILLKDSYPYVKKSALDQKKERDKLFISDVDNEKVREEFKQRLQTFAKTHSTSEVDEVRKLSEILYNEMIRVTRHKLKNILPPLNWYLRDINQALEENGVINDKLEKSKHYAMLKMLYLKEITHELGKAIIDPKGMKYSKVIFQELLDEVKDGILKTFEQESVVGEVEFCLDIEQDLVAEISRQHMYDTLFNIIKNGLEAQEDENKIEIKAYTVGENVTIEIIDHGVGFEEENLFSYYYPGFSDKDKGPGSGYGVYLSSTNIHKHHGTIEVDNSPDSGARIIIRIPKEQRHG